MKHFFKFMAVSLCVLGMSGFEAMAKVASAKFTGTHKVASNLQPARTWSGPTAIVYKHTKYSYPLGYNVKIYFIVDGKTVTLTVPSWIAINVVAKTKTNKGIALSNGIFKIKANCTPCTAGYEITQMTAFFKDLKKANYQDTAINVVPSKTNELSYSQLTSK